MLLHLDRHLRFYPLWELAFPNSHKSHNLAAVGSLVTLARQSWRICMLLEAFVLHLPSLLSALLQENLRTLSG